MAPSHTICEAVQLEHALRVVRVQRGWQTAVAARADHQLPARVALRRRICGLLDMVGAALTRAGSLVTDSRDGLRSKEHELAAHGVRWVTDPAEDERLADELRWASRRAVAIPVQAAHAREHPSSMGPMADERAFGTPLAEDRYPILSAIDRTRDDGRPGFAEDSDAARLEQLARRLTEQIWSDTAWVTGFIPERAFCFVCQVLERERTAAARLEADLADLGTAA